MADPFPERSTQPQAQLTRKCLEAAALRDSVSEARDQRASVRDIHAELRDLTMDTRDRDWAGDRSTPAAADAVLGAAEQRRHAAADRAAGAEARNWAADDREQATLDREQGARDRSLAQIDRDALVSLLTTACTDPLTGTRTRAAGRADLADEVDWARRTAGQLVVAYVEIAGLSAVNHAHGRAAGDQLLVSTVRAIEVHLQPHDSIARMGGNEFLCLMPGASLQDACTRFAAAQPSLAGELTLGFAALAPDEDPDQLVDRAQAESLINRWRTR
jgi:GGDEF domain-containing protein